ncbi:integrase (fragment) (modular protein) [Vibrio nigripulchritudo MADA3029]
MSPQRATNQLLILSFNYQKLGLNTDYYGTHSMRRTKATLIYARTKNIRAVQILLGHSKLDNTIRYLGVELEVSEKTDC